MADKSNDEKRAQKKRKKKYQGGKSAKYLKGGPPCLSLGMNGVLVTTNSRENACIREAYNLLNEYADKLYGPEFSNSDSEDALGDIDDQITKEVAALRARGGKDGRERRFQSVTTGTKCVVFIACCSTVDPNHLIHEALTDIQASKVQKSRYCCRMLPLSVVSRASLEDIAKCAKPIINAHFQHDDPTKFAVHFKSRNNNVISREKVIQLMASLVTGDSMYPHIVDLKNPQLVVCVEVIKNLCCIGVLKDYYQLKQYNIQALTDTKSASEREAVSKKDDTTSSSVDDSSRTIKENTTSTSVDKSSSTIKEDTTNSSGSMPSNIKEDTISTSTSEDSSPSNRKEEENNKQTESVT